jgi:hypothetical protein
VASIGMMLLGSVQRDLPRLGALSYTLNLLGMLICTIVCGVIAGRRRSMDFGMLTFVGTFFFYVAVLIVAYMALYFASPR